MQMAVTPQVSQATAAVVGVTVKIGLIILDMVGHILTRWAATTITEVTLDVVGWYKYHGHNIQQKERQR